MAKKLMQEEMQTVNAIIINPQDNVATLCEDAAKGSHIHTESGYVELLQDTGTGHKVALKDLEKGMKVMKYNSVMGTCSQAIKTGEWVHTHNVKSDYMKNEGEGAIDE